MYTTNLDDSDEHGEGNQQDDRVSGAESVGEIVVVLRASLRCRRYHSDDLVHDRLASFRRCSDKIGIQVAIPTTAI